MSTRLNDRRNCIQGVFECKCQMEQLLVYDFCYYALLRETCGTLVSLLRKFVFVFLVVKCRTKMAPFGMRNLFFIYILMESDDEFNDVVWTPK